MSTRIFRTSAEGFAVTSAIVGVMLAALLAQTKVLAFGSFRMMAAVFMAADLADLHHHEGRHHQIAGRVGAAEVVV